MTVNKPLPSLPTDPSRKALPTPPIKRPIPPPKPSKQEDVKTQEIREQIPQAEVNAPKKPTPKASFNIGKSGDKLKNNIGKFFKDFSSAKKNSGIDPRIKFEEMKKNHGLHENISLEEAEKRILQKGGVNNKALIRSENGETHITRIYYVKTGGGEVTKKLEDDRIDNKTFTNEEIALINRWGQKQSSGFDWISP